MSPAAPVRGVRDRRLAPDEDDLAFATVAELSKLLARGKASPVELAQLAIARLERLGPRYNAVATVTADRALREAKRAEAALRDRQKSGQKPGGALLGIPYGAKDLLAARGAPTTWGAPPYRDRVLDFDATVVRRLGRAGAVLAAKLAMVELAGGGGYRYASASLQGPGRTPWKPDHWSGGSSSGSGAAVAAGLVPYAIGSETSGSIVTPASYCGVTGLRPTYGLVSRHGAMALSWTLDKLGPMARSAEDCGLVLEAMAGPDARDPGSAHRRFRYEPLKTAELKQLRLGFAPADFDELAAEAARPTFAEAVRALRGLGSTWTERALPKELPYGPVVGAVIAGEASAIFGDLIESKAFEQLVDAKQKAGLRAGLDLSARDYLNAMRIRVQIQDTFRALFRDVDLIVGVGRGTPASPIDEPLDRRPGSLNPATPPPDRLGNPALIPAGNLAGLPAICFPCGFTPDGLPLALQLVGPPFSESRLLSLAHWFQTQTDWHRLRPPV